MSDQRIYRLNVVLPEDADEYDWEPEGWDADPEHYYRDLETGAEELSPFSWPRNRTYLSRSGAERRANLFRKYGATATVEPSEPVVWGAKSWALPEQPPVGTVLKGANRGIYFRRILDGDIDGWAAELDAAPTDDRLPVLEWIHVLKHGPLTLVDGEVTR